MWCTYVNTAIYRFKLTIINIQIYTWYTYMYIRYVYVYKYSLSLYICIGTWICQKSKSTDPKPQSMSEKVRFIYPENLLPPEPPAIFRSTSPKESSWTDTCLDFFDFSHPSFRKSMLSLVILAILLKTQHIFFQVNHEKKKHLIYFPWNPGCLIGILSSWLMKKK